MSAEGGTEGDTGPHPEVDVLADPLALAMELCSEETAQTQMDSHDDSEIGRTPNPGDVGSSTATVKVVLMPEGHVMTVAFAIGLSIHKLKCHLASELRVPVEVLRLSLDGAVLQEQQSLIELGIRPHSSTRIEMTSTEPHSHPLRRLPPPEHDSMPDVITVRVQKDEEQLQEVVVEIERPLQRAAFLGGYKHRLTGVEYHHANTQTLPKKRPDRSEAVSHRNTQTAELKSQAQQCPVDSSTQTNRTGYYVSCMKDKLVTPGNYTTAEEYHDRRLKAVICLQSWTRCWLARQFVDRLRQERKRRLDWLDMMERRRNEEKEKQLEDRRQRWMNPQRREDFRLLYQALQKWRVEEEEQIDSSLRGAERKAALCALSEQETQLIAAIGRHRIAVQSDNYDKVIKNLLDKSAAPLQWQAKDGRVIEVDNPHTIRAAELRDLYNSINQSDASKDQRLQVLKALKHTVMEQNGKLTRDIVDLIDREVDLMSRAVRSRCLEGLRKRICTLFLQYIKTPEFNPGIAKYLKVPQDPSKLRDDLFLCCQCQRYLCSKDFSVSARVSKTSRCRECTELNNISRARVDFSCYKNILMRLRADEHQINKEAKIPFLMQVEDMHYLTEVIWGSHSALQASRDIYNLVFIRWEGDEDWSPWNCILLTKEETLAHQEVKDVHKAYRPAFIREIKHKHSLARRHFGLIPAVAEHLESAQAAAHRDGLVSRHVGTAMDKHAADATNESAH